VTGIEGLIALVIVVAGGLFYFGKIGKLNLKAKGFEIGIEAPPERTEESIEKELRGKEKNLQEQLDLEATDDQEKFNTLQQELAGVHAKLADTKKALADSNAALSAVGKSLENEKLKQAVSEEKLAEAKQKLEAGDASALENLFSQFIDAKQSQDAPWAEVAFSLGKLAEDRIDYKTAQNYFEQAVQLAPANSLYLNEAGILAGTLGYFDKAIEYFEKALASDLKSLGPEHPNIARAWNNLGSVWQEKGEYDKAIDYYGKALESVLKSFGLEYPNVASCWNNLGLAWQNKKEYDKAIEYFEKALDSILKSLGSEHPKVATCWNNLGLAWQKKGEYDKAIDYYGKALESDLKSFGDDHPNVARTWNNLGGAWKDKGEYEKSLKYFEKALAVVEKAGLPHRVQLVKGNIDELKKSLGGQ
jgi:tetratricopeptide (TPR) repeat protein